MPLLRITHAKGSLTDSQKVELAERVTPVLIEGEVGIDNSDGRRLAYVIFHEIDSKTDFFVGGKPDINPPEGGRFMFEIWYVEGASTQKEKTIVHDKMNRIISDVIGVDGTFPNRLTDWVIINEVAEGTWGAGGQTVGVTAANEALGGSADRNEYSDKYLAAKERSLKASGFPTER